MPIKLTILGNNSALPAYGRHPTAQVVDIREQLFLVDCGEGTQIQMQRFGVKRRRINYIFISHLHGDHYFGLLGLITSMGLLGRTQALHLFGPPQLKSIIDLQLSVANTTLPYQIHFNAIEDADAKMLVDTPHYSVSCFPVEHRIPCHGFLFTEKHDSRKILPEKCKEYEVPTAFYNYLKQGEDYTRRDGFVVKNEWVTTASPAGKKYAFCADTVYTDSYLQYIDGADAIYHESTYLKDATERARERYHCTSVQAATIAKSANAKRLLLGHFSSKYQYLDAFYHEAKEIFPDTEVTIEGTTYEV